MSRQKDAKSLQRRMDGAEMGVGKRIFVRGNSLCKTAEWKDLRPSSMANLSLVSWTSKRETEDAAGGND